MIEEVKVNLVVSGITHRGDIDALLELQPSILHEQGEDRTVGIPPVKLGLKYEENTWILSATRDKINSIEDGLNALVNTLDGYEEVLEPLAQKYEAEVSIVVYFRGANPGFSISKKLLNHLNTLDINLDFDMYCMGEDKD
jgi:Ribonuclease G/E